MPNPIFYYKIGEIVYVTFQYLDQSHKVKAEIKFISLARKLIDVKLVDTHVEVRGELYVIRKNDSLILEVEPHKIKKYYEPSTQSYKDLLRS